MTTLLTKTEQKMTDAAIASAVRRLLAVKRQVAAQGWPREQVQREVAQIQRELRAITEGLAE